MRIVLASTSPRRRELLSALVAEFSIVPPDVPEETTGAPAADARRLALAKARAVATAEPGATVIGADTIVHDGVRTYGKPANAADGTAMLRALRGREHTVYTGIAVVREGLELTAVSSARVRLANLSDEQIETYVASGRPLDKAGAYAIQDVDVPTVAALNGCRCCVVGLPLWNLRSLLAAAGAPAHDPAEQLAACRDCPEREDKDRR